MKKHLIVVPIYLLLIAFGVYLNSLTPSVQAATPMAVSKNCVLDSTIGLIQVYYCESDFTDSYLINSVGFMLPDQY